MCVQAGGACGIWPVFLSKYFERVYTFEPQSVNFECLKQNTRDCSNVYATCAALGAEWGKGTMALHISEENNSGAYYVSNGEGVTILPLDSLHLSKCGFIQLDVEGYEYDVLRGAEETLLRCKPVVMVEEKPLPQMRRHSYPAEFRARRFLEMHGYREVHRVHRDIVFVC